MFFSEKQLGAAPLSDSTFTFMLVLNAGSGKGLLKSLTSTCFQIDVSVTRLWVEGKSQLLMICGKSASAT